MDPALISARGVLEELIDEFVVTPSLGSLHDIRCKSLKEAMKIRGNHEVYGVLKDRYSHKDYIVCKVVDDVLTLL